MTTRLAALATALAGVVTLASSLSANEPGRQAWLEAFEPGSAQSAAHALGAVGGLLTLWLAFGVLRGRRPAARAAVVVLGVLVLVHLAKGLDYEEAAIALVLALALHRGLEQVGAERRPSRSLVATLALLVGIAGAYAATLTTLLVSGHSADLEQTLWVAARALVIGAPAAVSGSTLTWLHLAGAFAVAAVVVVLRALLAPAHARDGHGEHEHHRAAAIVAAHGADSIAPFALRADKAYFFSHGGVVAYRTLRETAVVAGDPVGPPGTAGEILADFDAFARGRGWDVVVLGARAENLDGYAALGLRTMQVGLEAVVAPCSFDLDAPASKTVRKAVRRVARRGWTVELVRGAQLNPRLIADLVGVEAAWRRRGHHRLYGFAMASDRLWGAPEDCGDVYAIARNPDGEARAFQRYVPYRGGLSLDAMRRLDDDPNGISDALVAATLDPRARSGPRRGLAELRRLRPPDGRRHARAAQPPGCPLDIAPPARALPARAPRALREQVRATSGGRASWPTPPARGCRSRLCASCRPRPTSGRPRRGRLRARGARPHGPSPARARPRAPSARRPAR